MLWMTLSAVTNIWQEVDGLDDFLIIIGFVGLFIHLVRSVESGPSEFNDLKDGSTHL